MWNNLSLLALSYLITLPGTFILVGSWLHFHSLVPISDNELESLVTILDLISGINRVPKILGRLAGGPTLAPCMNATGLCLLFPLLKQFRCSKTTLEEVFIFIPLSYS